MTMVNKPNDPISADLLPVGIVKEQSITEEMRRAYLDYAMSVIVSRALPDVRDGMKPCLLYTSPSPRD